MRTTKWLKRLPAVLWHERVRIKALPDFPEEADNLQNRFTVLHSDGEYPKATHSVRYPSGIEF